jgi:hypothetical protein
LERKPYNILFFLEHGVFPWKDDGFRVEDQEQMTALLFGVLGGRFRPVLASAKTEIVIVPRELRTVDARLDFCINCIRNLGSWM